MTTYQPSNSRNAFLKTTDIIPKDPEDLSNHITHSYTEMAQAINVREIAQYDEQEILTGQQFFTIGNNQKKKYTYRKAFSFGSINAGATKPIPHGITNLVQFTRIYGTCITSGPTTYRPIPYASVTAANACIEVYVDNSGNIQIVNGAAASNITSGIVVLEYLKN